MNMPESTVGCEWLQRIKEGEVGTEIFHSSHGITAHPGANCSGTMFECDLLLTRWKHHCRALLAIASSITR